MIQLKPGDQIVYIPCHAMHAQDHPDREYGFVTSVRSNHKIAFCRYWNKYQIGILRTCANSEGTRFENLRHHRTVPQKVVDEMMRKLKKGEDL